MMENDNRVYYRTRGSWRITTAGCELDYQPQDGWPPGLLGGIEKNAEIITWRGKILKDPWGNYTREDFLEGLKALNVQVES